MKMKGDNAIKHLANFLGKHSILFLSLLIQKNEELSLWIVVKMKGDNAIKHLANSLACNV